MGFQAAFQRHLTVALFLLATTGLCSGSSLLQRTPLLELEDRADSDCTDVHIFLARGNNEPFPGRQGRLVAAICDGLSSCDYEDLLYSALYTDLYCQTVYDGVNAGHTQVAAYADRCPKSKLILAGYSQGAQIMTDILGGSGGVLFNGCVQPGVAAMDRSTSPGNRISAAIVFGDVRHTAGQSYNFDKGSSFQGNFPRPQDQLNNLNKYKSVLRNWCRSTDPVCAASSPSTNVADHLSYYDTLSDQAASWVKSVAKLKNDVATSVPAAIPTSISGTVQDYNTIGTETPSGTVVLTTPATTTTRPVTTTRSRASTATSTSSSQGSFVTTPTARSSTGAGASITTSQATTTTAAPSSTGTAAAASTTAPSAADARNSASRSAGAVALLALLIMSMI